MTSLTIKCHCIDCFLNQTLRRKDSLIVADAEVFCCADIPLRSCDPRSRRTFRPPKVYRPPAVRVFAREGRVTLGERRPQELISST